MFLNKSINYEIFLHDKDFFLYSTKEKAIPRFLLDLTSEKISFVIPNIEVIQHHNLPLIQKPCNNNPSYSFKDCIKRSAENTMGCGLPWDVPQLNSPVCTTFHQFLDYEAFYWNISTMEQKLVKRITGCEVPCQYRSFQQVGRPLEYKPKRFGFGISIVSTDITVKTEELVYPFSSFVSEFGGALGLFLGFSFYMVWDAAFSLIQNYYFRTFQANI